jgi:pSer/pThr/pTyr-binding forkhead associated (FHA) protein
VASATAQSSAQSSAQSTATSAANLPSASAGNLGTFGGAAAPSELAASHAKAASDAKGATTECPQCGHTNKLGNRFCASCGFNLSTSNPPAVAPRPAPVAAGGAAPSVSISLTARRADGTEAGTFALPSQPTTLLGRDTGSIFAGDSYLSPRHASINVSGSQVMIRDEGSLNGVYLKLRPQTPWLLKFNDLFRIGQEIIKLEALDNQPPGADGVERLGSPRDGYVGRLALVIGRDTTGNAFPIPRGGVHCGRERGDILFSEDGYVSGLHCRIAPESDGNIYLTDVGSSNGTFVRLGRDHILSPGDILLMGQQLFRVDIR